MKAFDYVRATSLEHAIEAGASSGAVFLAGGTNLLDRMKMGITAPDIVVDIGRIASLRDIAWGGNGDLRIGALVSNSQMAADERFAASFPAIAEAILSGASGQLRNAATFGGNILQEVRCPYFYEPSSRCNRRSAGSGCDAIDGSMKSPAVLGWTKACIATHPSDLCVALVAAGAEVEIAGPAGTRCVLLEQLYSDPDADKPSRAELAKGEIVTAICLPAQAAEFAGHARYLKLRDRTSYAFALVSAAAMLRLDGGVIAEARIALGGAAPRPLRAHAAEALLTGRAPDASAFEAAADAALAGAKAPGGDGHKIELARRIVARSLAAAAQGTPQPLPVLPGSVFAAEGENV